MKNFDVNTFDVEIERGIIQHPRVRSSTAVGLPVECVPEAGAGFSADSLGMASRLRQALTEESVHDSRI